MGRFGNKGRIESDSEDSEFLVNFNNPNMPRFYFRWTEEENLIYVNFLEKHQDEFASDSKRRSSKFFKKMADQLQIGKSNLQCRSHHQKMVNRYGSVQQLLQAFSAGEEVKCEVKKEEPSDTEEYHIKD